MFSKNDTMKYVSDGVVFLTTNLKPIEYFKRLDEKIFSESDTIKSYMKRQKTVQAKRCKYLPNRKRKECTSHQNIFMKIQFLKVKEECATVAYVNKREFFSQS